MKKERFNGDWAIGPKSTANSLFGDRPRPVPVTLPHDAMIGGKRDAAAPGGRDKGFFLNGQWEYTKTFSLSEEYRDKRAFLEFEGVYRTSQVFVNGEYAGEHPYGYSNFYVALDKFLKYGEDNTVRVTAETSEDSRWYSGAGIYRNVNLITGELTAFALNGVKITTAAIGGDYAVVEIENRLESRNHRTLQAALLTEIVDNDGKTAARDKAPVTLYEGADTVVRQRIVIKKPRLWDTESPYLYTCKSSLCDTKDNRIIDTEENTFGVRVLKLDTERGLQLNGKTVKLRGACIHHDNGVIGAATFERAEERRAAMLKKAGFNSLRSAHHPMSKAMLNACDRIGLLVMDEAFDMWTLAKTPHDYSHHFPEWWERDIEAIVDKDYNHPCVVLYSIGNEIPETGKPGGTQWGRKLAEKIRSMDKTRYITNSVNGVFAITEELAKMRRQMSGQPSQPAQEGADKADINTTMADMSARLKRVMDSELVGNATEESFSCVDVAGYNYMDSRYESDRAMYPNRVLCGSETFPRDIFSNWALVEKLPGVIGDFTWTGWDYLGEAGIGKIAYTEATDMAEIQRLITGEYPWIAAWCGDMDITGFRRPISYYREIVWGLRKEPYIAVQKPEYYGKKAAVSPWAFSDASASWTWPGFEGKAIKVEVYSDAEEVALLLNGKEIGRAAPDKCKVIFDTVYTPGNLEAVAYSGGKKAGRFVIATADQDVSLSLVCDRDTLNLGCGDLAYIGIALTDKNGVVNPSIEKKLRITVEGAGVLQGFGSGNPVTEESYTDAEHTTFDGRALAVIRPRETGTIRLTLSAEGIESAMREIKVV
jgi:beta-galactosidase